jgi:hypothetical protein
MSDRFDARRSQIREARGLVLDFLNATYPASLDEGQIIQVMLDLPEPVVEEYVRRDLGYLKARGLIQDEWAEHPVRKTRVHRWLLTARGVTFLERSKPWDELEAV